jgi:hypothetical protein
MDCGFHRSNQTLIREAVDIHEEETKGDRSIRVLKAKKLSNELAYQYCY